LVRQKVAEIYQKCEGNKGWTIDAQII